MQIEKINENQIEIIIDFEDLMEKNISVHSFMCNSLESQNFFFDIINFANKEINFSLKNYKIVIESFSLPAKNSFVLFITRIPKESKLHISKNKYEKFTVSKSFWIKFTNFEDLCMFCNSLSNNIKLKSSLYTLNCSYFLYIKILYLKDLFKILLSAKEFSDYFFSNNFIIDENAKAIIKDFAVETAKKYFV